MISTTRVAGLERKIESRKLWFGGGWCSSFELSWKACGGQKTQSESLNVSIFAQSLLRALTVFRSFNVPSPKEEGIIVCNLRGRPLESFSLQTHPDIPPGYEELYFLSGNVLLKQDLSIGEKDPSSQKQNHTALISEPQPFSWQVVTKFDSFTRKSILHRASSLIYGTEDVVNLIKDRAAISPQNWSFLFEQEDIEITTMRLGFENFKSRFLGPWFGMTPDIYRRLFVQATPLSLDILAEEERLSQRNELPFAREDLCDRLEKIVQESVFAE